jgi:hypothetical protein
MRVRAGESGARAARFDEEISGRIVLEQVYQISSSSLDQVDTIARGALRLLITMPAASVTDPFKSVPLPLAVNTPPAIENNCSPFAGAEIDPDTMRVPVAVFAARAVTVALTFADA